MIIVSENMAEHSCLLVEKPQRRHRPGQIFIMEEELEDTSYGQNSNFLDNYHCIGINETPTCDYWKLPPLYKFGNNGLLYLWQIGFSGDSLYIVEGLHTSLKVDPRKVETNKSKRSLLEQALQEANTRHKDKVLAGYLVCGSNDTGMAKGMKGVHYHPRYAEHFPMLGSRKLNGIRLICQIQNGVLVMMSYLNRSFGHMKYIKKEMEMFSTFFDPGTTFDGEMYYHGMELYEIEGPVRTVIGEHPDQYKIIYYIFDVILDAPTPAETRYSILQTAYNKWTVSGYTPKNVIYVDAYPIMSEKEAYQAKEYYVKQGYEGLMLKRIAWTGTNEPPSKERYEMSLYKAGRSVRSLKLKDFFDEEGIVVGVKAAKGKESNLAMLLILDGYGVTTPIRGGADSERAKWLQNPASVIGRPYTFKHVGRSDKNKPIQPTAVGFRDYE